MDKRERFETEVREEGKWWPQVGCFFKLERAKTSADRQANWRGVPMRVVRVEAHKLVPVYTAMPKRKAEVGR